MKILFTILFIVLTLIIGTVILNVYLNIKTKQDYTDYYEFSCFTEEKEHELLNPGDQVYELCKSTGGCYNICGSQCKPKQSYTFKEALRFVAIREICISGCMPECVCPLGSDFDKTLGCVENIKNS